MTTLAQFIANQTNGTCPNCGDNLSATIGNLKPSWSDYFDNIVCWWCKCHPTETDRGI